eukprot:TRINITY_DN6852_c0_g2_i5.p1 TRINITY_DN6852_c0_g2~~TRINITY_DN6852_c0_g2_i5.p1  ORF type:complete len:366 (+),score=89.42 TRINITY_DN6852_c0_g2_i5:52-1149(+)
MEKESPLKRSASETLQIGSQTEVSDAKKQKSEEKPSKADETQSNVHIFAAVYGSKGIRPAMEDEHVIKFDLLQDYVEKKQSQVLFSQKSSITNPHQRHRVMFFAVYDGHGGRACSQYLREHLDFQIADALVTLPSLKDGNQVKKAITEAFKKTDQAFSKLAEDTNLDDGSTAIIMLIIDQMAYVANVGDSRAILGREAEESGSVVLKSMALGIEHKAILFDERKRIEKAGGFVEDGRVAGRIEVTRAFGDVKFKKMGIIALPDIQKFKISPKDRFCVLACDGLWKVFDPKLVTKYTDDRTRHHQNPPVDASGTAPEGIAPGNHLCLVLARDLVKEAIEEKKSKDNVSVLVVQFMTVEGGANSEST